MWNTYISHSLIDSLTDSLTHWLTHPRSITYSTRRLRGIFFYKKITQKWIRAWTGSQWRSWSACVTWEYLLMFIASLAAAFWTHCNLTICDLGRPYIRLLQKSKRQIINAWMSANKESRDRYFLMHLIYVLNRVRISNPWRHLYTQTWVKYPPGWLYISHFLLCANR